jgi:hypothetical protein
VCQKAREGKWGEKNIGVIIYWLVMWEIDRTKLPENTPIEGTKEVERKAKSAIEGKM